MKNPEDTFGLIERHDWSCPRCRGPLNNIEKRVTPVTHNIVYCLKCNVYLIRKDMAIIDKELQMIELNRRISVLESKSNETKNL